MNQLLNKKVLQVVHILQIKRLWMVFKVLKISLVIDQMAFYQHGALRRERLARVKRTTTKDTSLRTPVSSYINGDIVFPWKFVNTVQTFLKTYLGSWWTDIQALANWSWIWTNRLHTERLGNWWSLVNLPVGKIKSDILLSFQQQFAGYWNDKSPGCIVGWKQCISRCKR